MRGVGVLKAEGRACHGQNDDGANEDENGGKDDGGHIHIVGVLVVVAVFVVDLGGGGWRGGRKGAGGEGVLSGD